MRLQQFAKKTDTGVWPNGWTFSPRKEKTHKRPTRRPFDKPFELFGLLQTLNKSFAMLNYTGFVC